MTSDLGLTIGRKEEIFAAQKRWLTVESEYYEASVAAYINMCCLQVLTRFGSLFICVRSCPMNQANSLILPNSIPNIFKRSIKVEKDEVFALDEVSM